MTFFTLRVKLCVKCERLEVCSLALVHQRSNSKLGRNLARILPKLIPIPGLQQVADFALNYTTASQYDQYADEYAESLAQSLQSQYPEFSTDELKTLLKSGLGETPGFWSRLGKNNTLIGSLITAGEDENYVTELDAATKDLLAQLQRASELGDMPEVSLDAAMDRARSDVDAELNQQEQVLADLLQQQNLAYNDTAEQILSSDYQRNASLMGTYQSEMRRSQRNALEAGASAGARLANNINVTLSTQNQQAQQSLETSNNLAQMLLNQRQAASDIAQQRVGLRSGYTERVNSLGQQYYNDDDTRRGEWEDRARTTLDPTGTGNSKYTDAILNRRRNKSYTSNASGKPGGTVY